MFRSLIRKVIIHIEKKFHIFFNKLIFKKSNSFVGVDYDNYFKQVRENYKDIDNPFWYYEKLVDDLLNIEDVEILPLKEFVKKDNSGKIQIGFRHDIDADPITAVRCARALAQRGLSGSFYFLHSALYYGEFYNNVFVRNPQVVDWVKQIVIAGSEIGIHNDAIGISKNHKIDGIKHLETEINWMRSIGTNIYGTVAHNNFLLHNAENYEIFKEHQLFKRNFLWKFLNNIGKVTKEPFGLEYEGTFAKEKLIMNKQSIKKYVDKYKNTASKKEWMYEYFFNNPINDWSCEIQIWIVGKNKWIIASKQNEKNIFEYDVPLSKVVDFIKNDIQVSSSILFVLHPEYFGGR
ncbi:hypothetical protein [Aliarcobacter cryaerophilus]|uniref:hypothetical protein n=1 Tax=Aliarcobacter cryaerophilus TaxID=28198 RepID=UPI003BB115BB